jgi:hypothetical protein
MNTWNGDKIEFENGGLDGCVSASDNTDSKRHCLRNKIVYKSISTQILTFFLISPLKLQSYMTILSV